MRVFIGEGAFYGNVLRMFHKRGFKITENVSEADALVLTGGADISPGLYGESPISETYFSTETDDYDISLYNSFDGKPKLGICRGAQLLNVLSGGKLWQDVDRHHTNHDGIDVESGKTVRLSSIHHQMMRPSPKGFILTTSRVSTVRKSFGFVEGNNSKTFGEDIEAVLYKDTMSLCFQGHPEIGPPECTDYFFDLAEKHLDVSP